MLAERILRIHPAVISCFFGIGVVVSGSFGPPQSVRDAAITPLICAAIMMSIGASWLYALYSLSVRKRGRSVTPASLNPFPFVASAVAAWLLVLTLALQKTTIGASSGALYQLVVGSANACVVVAAISALVSSWLSAHALEAFEEKSLDVPWTRVVGTFLLVAYLFIGIWFLRGRIKRLLEAED